MKMLKKIIKSKLEKYGYRAIKIENLDTLENCATDVILFLNSIIHTQTGKAIEPTSQLGQDTIALIINKFKEHGFFVEFGATDGKTLSNSYNLEKVFNWNGILAEPNVQWHNKLKNNRSCIIETDCVWSKTGETLSFVEAEEGELSSLTEFMHSDFHGENRKHGKFTEVTTITLIDLLRKYNAPKTIDYLSIDTEGSEFEILKEFDFDAYKFNFITVEHNFSENRLRIYELLTRNGYLRILPGVSRWDDWYIPIKYS